MNPELQWTVLGYFYEIFREYADRASPDAEEVVKTVRCTEAEAEKAISVLRGKGLLIRTLTYGAFQITPLGILVWEKSRR